MDDDMGLYWATISISFLCSAITFAITVIVMVVIYDCYLRPQLERKYLKVKNN